MHQLQMILTLFYLWNSINFKRKFVCLFKFIPNISQESNKFNDVYLLCFWSAIIEKWGFYVLFW